MYPQNAYNLIAEIKANEVENLAKILATIQVDVEDNPYFVFSNMPTIHFARFVILDAKTASSDKLYPAYLAFESNYDGNLKEHLKEIIQQTKANNGFNLIFGCCKNFPTKAVITDEEKLDFLIKESQYHPYFYRGTWGRTVRQIKAEEQTRVDIQLYLNSNPQLRTKSERDIYNLLKQNDEQLKKERNTPLYVTQYPPSIDSLWLRVGLYLSPFIISIFYLIATGIYGLICLFSGNTFTLFVPLALHYLFIALTVVFLVLFPLVVLILYRILRKKEETDVALNKLYDPNPDTSSLRTAEDRIVQNQLTHLVELKEGSFRRFMLKFVLTAVEVAGIYYFNKGTLGGIPSIHFARWIIIDKGKRLLFYSNFDGSWENYLGDFIDRASVGLTAVWSNTKLFPKSKNLVQEGALDEQKFKSWTRMLQIPTQVWYSAYKYLTVENINNNTAISEGLKKNLTDIEIKNWLLKI
jgi:hypothetical protein